MSGPEESIPAKRFGGKVRGEVHSLPWKPTFSCVVPSKGSDISL